ncbi:hypothetical protein AMK15_01555 [Streptomyces sp. MJM1172]|nr:hypothetical protein AMK15_01555 [Streptomyces sp. MJM1172]
MGEHDEESHDQGEAGADAPEHATEDVEARRLVGRQGRDDHEQRHEDGQREAAHDEERRPPACDVTDER